MPPIGSAATMPVSQAITMPGKNASTTPERAKELAKQFESIFIGTMVGTMFEGVGEDPMVSGGSAGLQWRSLLINQYANAMEARGGLGLANSISHSILHLQEGAGS